MNSAVLVALLAVIAFAYAGTGFCVPVNGTSSFCGSLTPSKTCSPVSGITIDGTLTSETLFNAEVNGFNATLVCPVNPSLATKPTKAEYCSLSSYVASSCSTDSDCKQLCFSTCLKCQTNDICTAAAALPNSPIAKSGDSVCASPAAVLKAGFLFVVFAVALLF